ncbi:MAG TPA: polymer-forming cytoskeletal protein [Candidatus Hydrogenedentes bacterium]|nr:polymer-forming cytoskeletal protein [Candidatus Hydrogenedentota bacterium]
MYSRHGKPTRLRLRAAQKQGKESGLRGERLDLESDTPSSPERLESLEDLENARKKGLFSKVNDRFQDALQSGRGGDRVRNAAVEAGPDPGVTADDLAIRRAKNVTAQRMIVPEGVIIEGSMTSGSETEISGKIDGDVSVEGRLLLGASALVTGNVRATFCKIEGLVDGKVECSQELELGKTGRLNGDVLSGKSFYMAGQVFGNVTTGGMLHIAESAKLQGDVRVRRLTIEEGGVFNGSCVMRMPSQRKEGEN